MNKAKGRFKDYAMAPDALFILLIYKYKLNLQCYSSESIWKHVFVQKNFLTRGAVAVLLFFMTCISLPSKLPETSHTQDCNSVTDFFS